MIKDRCRRAATALPLFVLTALVVFPADDATPAPAPAPTSAPTAPRTFATLEQAEDLFQTLIDGRELAADELPEPSADAAAIVFQNRDIAVLRARWVGFAPSQRAAAAERRIHRALADGQPRAVTARRVAVGQVLFAGDKPLFVLADADVDIQGGELPAEALERTMRALRLAIDEATVQQRAPYMLRAAAVAVAGSLFFAVLLYLVNRFRRFALGRLARATVAQLKRFDPADFVDRRARSLEILTGRFFSLVAALAGLVLVSMWIVFVLRRFPYVRPWGEMLFAYVYGTFSSIALALAGALPGLLRVVIIFALARYAIKGIGFVLKAIEERQIEVPMIHPDIVDPTRKLTTIGLWLFAIIAAYPYLPGSDSAAFRGMSVLLGLMLSLGSSSVVTQAMSGFVLMYSRALRVGEFVVIGETEGSVTQLGVLSTKIRTNRNVEVTIPNSVVLSQQTKNFSRHTGADAALIGTTVTIGYDAPWRQVHAMLLAAAARTPGIVPEPPPRVLQGALSDFYVEYTLVLRPEDPARRALLLSELHAHIQDEFNVHGVQIMSPHFEAQPPEKVWVPGERWHEPPAPPADAAGRDAP